MMDNGILPGYSEAGFEIAERITPDGIVVNVLVNDYRNFIDSLLEIKEGGKKSFTKHGPNKSVVINVVNTEFSKML